MIVGQRRPPRLRLAFELLLDPVPHFGWNACTATPVRDPAPVHDGDDRHLAPFVVG